MRLKTVITAVLFCFLVYLLPGCSQTDKSERANLSESALQGKEIFEAKECNKCHYVGDEEVASDAPDLLDPFLANNSSFVRAHLTFVEESKMPPVELTDKEIRLVSHYVGELYNSRLSLAPEEERDTYDPVTYAPLSSARAKQQKLSATFRGKRYFFATEKTLETFKKAPEAFVMLYQQFLEEKEGSNALGEK